MKTSVKMFAVAVLLIMSGQAMAQTRGAFFISATFPMKDYAAYNQISDFALASDDDNAAAAIGFGAALKWYYNVGVKGLGVMLSVDGIYNGLNADAKEFYKNRQAFLDGLGRDVKMTRPAYIHVPAMLGMNYIYRINPNFGVYGEAGAGANVRFITNYKESYIPLLGGKQSATVTYGTTVSFAWQVGAGIEVARNLVIGCSLYDLGATEVTAEMTGSEIITLSTPMPNHSIIHPIMVMGRLGFCF